MAFNQNMRVYIPLMNSVWANQEKIKDVFRKHMIGDVNQIKIVKKRSMKKERGYIHSAYIDLKWYCNETTRKLQNIMTASGIVSESKLFIDDEWYFLLLTSNHQI
jgi:hypothetical protein